MKIANLKKHHLIAVSLLLAVAMLFSNVAFIPKTVFAETDTDTEAVKSGAIIVNEDETKRGEYGQAIPYNQNGESLVALAENKSVEEQNQIFAQECYSCSTDCCGKLDYPSVMYTYDDSYEEISNFDKSALVYNFER